MDETTDRLIAVRCGNCGKLYISPVYVCLQCDQSEFKNVELTGKGRIRTYTTIRVPPLGFEKEAPYDIAVVELEEGVHVTARIIGKNEKLAIGAQVVFVKKEEGAHWFGLTH
ncbi:MAG: Zn-ribbon domain-containing OB-fold protein [Acidobacteria bacterium]|nr:Zn-ribbon domain-containing OB-fold protein [Acidobacteriota bacterium]